MCLDKHRNSCEVQVFKPAPFRGFLPHLPYSVSHILPHLRPHYHPPPRMLMGVNLLLVLNHSRDLAVQWLKLRTLISFGPEFDPWKGELRSLLAAWPKEKKKKTLTNDTQFSKAISIQFNLIQTTIYWVVSSVLDYGSTKVMVVSDLRELTFLEGRKAGKLLEYNVIRDITFSPIGNTYA